MVDPADLLAGIDAARPLPPGLRDRLEQQLLAADEVRALDRDLSARLTTRLTDPVSDLLAGLDAPRPLTPALRADLVSSLRPHRRQRVWIAAVASGVAASAVAAFLLNAPTHRGTTRAAGPPSPTPTSQPVQGTMVGVGGGGTVGGGTTGGGATAPTPTVAPRPQPPAAGGPLTVPGAAPAAGLGGVSPDAGPLDGGTIVRLDGAGLRTARRVEFGHADGTHLRVRDDGSLTVVTPAALTAGAVTIVVVLDDGSRLARPGGFTYLAPPRLDTLSPMSGPAAGGTWVTLAGTGLARTTSVRFGSTTATRVQAVSDTRVRALSPAHLAGPVDVTLATPGGTSGAARFLYLP